MARGTDRSISERANGSGAISTADQEEMFSREIQNEELEALLKEWEPRRLKKLTAAADFKLKDDRVKAMIADLGLEPGDVARVGRFRIKILAVNGSDVAFERASSTQTRIKFLGD
jgi:hypothetical protein